MIFSVGIFVYNEEQFNKICSLITNYIHCPPYNKLKGMAWFKLPLLEIAILIGSSHARGYKFDVLYYDEQIDETLLYEVLYPCCPCGKPQPLERLLNRLI